MTLGSDLEDRQRLRLFVNMVDDLGRCLAGAEYEVLRIAGLLRPLIIDSLAAQVGRDLGVASSYTVGSHFGTRERAERVPPEERGTIFAMLDGFSPQAGGRREEVKLERLLALVVLFLDGQPVTVRELIKNAAFVQGVVHPGKPKSDLDALLARYRQEIEVMGLPGSLPTLRAIGRVVHAGLAPLREVAVQKLASGG